MDQTAYLARPTPARQLKLLASAILIAVTLPGCAVGNSHSYRDMTVFLPIIGSGDIGLAVVDQRSYIVSGKKKPEFVGLTRGGFGNSFNVRTESGQPLVEEMGIALERAITNAGFQVSNLGTSTSGTLDGQLISESPATKNLVLTVREWKSDVFIKLKVIYDLRLELLDRDGALLAANEVKGEEATGSGPIQGQQQVAVKGAFENQITELFNGVEIRSALHQADDSQR